MTPSFAVFDSRPSGFSRKRAAETSTLPFSGSSPSSATRTKMSVAILPFLTSGINPLLERFDAEPLHRIDEQFVGALAQREVGFDDILDHVGNFAIRNRRSDQHAKLGVLVGAAADRDLVKFLAVL